MDMKKAFMEGICCKGCAKEVQHIFEKIYGVSDVVVNVDDGYVQFEGHVSERVLNEALAGTDYVLVKIEKD